MIRTVRIIIAGRVQGVGYRAWTAATARKLRLNGWVRNLTDSTVEAVFSGNEETVEQMLEACKKGPLLANVKNIQQHAFKEVPESGFITRPTV